MAMLLAFRVPFTPMDAVALFQLAGAAIFSGLAASSIALLLQYFLAQALGLTTALQLIEISRPDFPLLQFFLRNAPGTYQHSLQVANLAEQAAEQIGANPLLTRVGALYHDSGKALNPQYFIENQIPDTPNLHDSLTAEESARVIIEHVSRGEEMARKHRLPKAIIAFILEHHGTTMTRYQYGRAINEASGDASEIDPELYRYPGPIPQTRETALVMLADGSEARTRAERPPTEHALRELIKDTIDTRIAEHQLDRVNLTPRDLNIILEIFTSTLKGVYHPRLDYPALDQRTIPALGRAQPAEPVALPESIADEG
jgi:putative nucleotidyltransferase with HDIG domain